jgi:hypothetical protein
MAVMGPHAVRQLPRGKWQVSLAEMCQWHTCLSERDARFIAQGLHLVAAVQRGEKSGVEIAMELDEVAVAVLRNLGECWALRIVKDAAACARLPVAQNH